MKNIGAGPASAVDCASDCRSRGLEFESQPGHITFMGIDHEIIPMAIHPLPVIQEGQLSVTGKSMCTKY